MAVVPDRGPPGSERGHQHCTNPVNGDNGDLFV